MFEKEAEKYVKAFTDRSHIWSNDKLMQLQLREAFKDGAEFGYNKANEWHYLSKGEYPKDGSFVLVLTIEGCITANYGEEYSDGVPENGLFQGIHISEVIAWKEIVLPELKESE